MSANSLAQVPARTSEPATQYTVQSIDKVCAPAPRTVHRSGSARAFLKKHLPTVGFDGDLKSSAASRTATMHVNQGTDHTFPDLPTNPSRKSIDIVFAKTTLPEFRQSKRWARAYEAAGGPRPTTASAVEHPHYEPSIGDHATRRSLDSAPSLQRSSNLCRDSGLVHKGFRGCVLLPSWHFFKRTRSKRQHIAVSQKCQTLKLRQQQSLDLIASKAPISPRRMSFLKHARGKGRRDHSAAMRDLQSMIGIKPCETVAETRESLTRDKAGGPKQGQLPTRASLIATDFWNSPRRSRRWSDDCRAMLRGEQLVDFDNEWRPEPFSAVVELAKPKGHTAHAGKHAQAGGLPSEIAADLPVVARPRPAGRGPVPPERTSSKGISVARAAQVKKWGRQPAVVDVRNVISQGRRASDSRISKCSSKLQQQIRHVQSSSTTISKMSNMNLKNAKSIDSMAQIEAHLQSPIKIDSSTTNSNHATAVCKLKSCTNLNVSPYKTKMPAGKPPERPLPDLPNVKFDSSYRAVAGHVTKPCGRRAKNVADVTTEIKPSRPENLVTSDPSYVRSDTDHASGARAPNLGPPTTSTDMSATKSNSQSSIALHEHFQRPMFKVKHLLTERSDKVHELKKKHVIALTKLQKTMAKGAGKDHQPSAAEVHRVSSIYKVIPALPSRPPPPPPTETERSIPPRTGTKLNRLDFSDDEYSVFPAPPVSRPASCESTATTVRSTRNCAQSLRASFSSRRNGSIVGPQSDHRPSSQHDRKPNGKPKQILSQSTIMIVCDTNPATENFRAGAKSPIPSITGLGSRSPTPRGQVYRSVKGCAGNTFANVDFVNIVELADFGTPGTLNKKHSLRDVRGQTGVSRNPIGSVGRHTPGRISPISKSSQHDPKQAGYLLFESDSEQETTQLTRSLSPVLIGPRTSSMLAVSRPSTRNKVARRRKSKTSADESEAYAEEMIRVITRYAGRGNKLAKQMLDQSTCLLKQGNAPDQHTSSRATRSPRSVHGGRPGDMPASRADIKRRISGKPISAAGDSDTDDSGHTILSISNRDSYKVASDGSMTDPTDYDTVIDSRASQKPSHYRDPPRSSSHPSKNYETRSLRSPGSLNNRRKRSISYSLTPPRPKTAVSSFAHTHASTRTTRTDTEAEAENQLESILRLLEAPTCHPAGRNRISIVGTERLYGVVDGMKLWPDLTSGFGGSGIVIEEAAGAAGGPRMLHSRFEL